jgi:signal transduction histidine kinase
LRAVALSTIDIRTFLNTTSGTVLANPTQLQQVLMNLASNAAYAMRTTGGVLEVHLDEADLPLHGAVASPLLLPGPYLRLMIRDTGVGMIAEVIARIFEPFFTTKGPDEGTGLGLAVVYGIISRHEGTITVASTPGQGTTFTIYLPRVAGRLRSGTALPRRSLWGRSTFCL